MKPTFLSIPLLLNFQVRGQQDFIPVDYDQIEKSIHDTASVYYYPKLRDLFEAGDTTLTVLDYFHLYYGYTLQEGWSSMVQFGNEEVKNILKKENPDADELRKAASALEAYLKEQPFDLKSRFDLMVVADLLDEQDKYELLKVQLQGLIGAIVETGDGLTLESAIHINTVAEEYFLLSILGFDYSGEQSLINPCDYLKVAENEYGVEGLYFNVQRHFDHLKQLFNKTNDKGKEAGGNQQGEKKGKN